MPVRPALARFLLLVSAAVCAPLFLTVASGTAAEPVETQSAQPTPASPPVDPAQVADLAVRATTILTTHCLKCHGGATTQAEFDLSTRDLALVGGQSGPVLVPGRALESRLYLSAAHAAEPFMPHEAPRLSDEDLSCLQTWIDQGAAYPQPLVEPTALPEASAVLPEGARDRWPFLRLAPCEPPAVEQATWCRTPVDRFLLRAWEAHAIQPPAEVDRGRLLRRLSLGLLGLPPTPTEREAFLNDNRPDALERLVDRLLASPHYGERWARHWLDLARFGESHGFEHDTDRPTAYHYRDFVIRALNEDLPYDTFVSWQIAGDELAPENPWALAATGFLAAGVHSTQITANQVEKERYDELDDMAATVGTGLLGLTVGCARCHDHKYDPIPQHDYYRLLATFTTTVRSEMDLDLDPAATAAAQAAFAAAHAPLQAALDHYDQDVLPGRARAWLDSNPQITAPDWLILEATSLTATGGATWLPQPAGSYLAQGPAADNDQYIFQSELPPGTIIGLRIEALADDSLAARGPGRADNGNFALSDLRLTIAPTGMGDTPTPVRLVRPRATFEQSGLPVAAVVDDDASSSWAVDPQFGQDHAAGFEFDSPLVVAGPTTATFTLSFNNNVRHSIGRLRVAVSLAEASLAEPSSTTDPTPAVLVELIGSAEPAALFAKAQAALAIAAADRTPDQMADLVGWVREHDEPRRELVRAIVKHQAQAAKPTTHKVLVASEGVPALRLNTQGADFFEQTFFLKRGDPLQKLGVAEPGFLQVLSTTGDPGRWHVPPPAGAHTSYRRASLARWLTDSHDGAGHLLARVIVNRLWQHHFGQPLVGTPSDFGAQGESPTHPELLDWLAQELIKGGWRLKPLHRLLVQSAAYAAADRYDPQALASDPQNRLLWRRPHRRLEAEAIRDSILAVSGRLDPTLYGPGSLDEGHLRRSIYFTIKRSQLIPFLSLFDAPDALSGQSRRSTTTIAAQALALLNHPQMQASAAAFAARLRQEQPTLEGQVELAWVAALTRPPQSHELAQALTFVQQQAARYADATLDSAATPADSTADQRALADLCQALLSLNEFLYVE